MKVFLAMDPETRALRAADTELDVPDDWPRREVTVDKALWSKRADDDRFHVDLWDRGGAPTWPQLP